jgi:hypothetical protein
VTLPRRTQRLAAIAIGTVASLALATTALATDCTNASKPAAAGVQVVINLQTGEIEWTTQGVAQRIERGVIDPATGEGFHGLLGFDFDGDGVVDVSTWDGVGPSGHEIPVQAQVNGPADRGVTSICALYPEICAGG